MNFQAIASPDFVTHQRALSAISAMFSPSVILSDVRVNRARVEGLRHSRW